MIERALRRLRPIDRIERIEDEHLTENWDRLLPTEGLVDFRESAALDLLRDVFVGFRQEYMAFPREPIGGGSGFYLNNGYFEAVDSEVLYCMVRHLKPRTVIEVGSGFSTLITRQALTVNGSAARLVAIDPEPRAAIRGTIDEHVAAPVEGLSTSFFEQLQAGDVLFIDSSHVVRAGGDVNFLVLHVLPRLRPGVLVHIHDIFLPYDYPRRWVAAGNTEQYLVLAFLAYNDAFEVVWPGHLMRMRYAREVMEAFPSCTEATHPGSLWLRRVITP